MNDPATQSAAETRRHANWPGLLVVVLVLAGIAGIVAVLTAPGETVFDRVLYRVGPHTDLADVEALRAEQRALGEELATILDPRADPERDEWMAAFEGDFLDHAREFVRAAREHIDQMEWAVRSAAWRRASRRKRLAVTCLDLARTFLEGILADLPRTGGAGRDDGEGP